MVVIMYGELFKNLKKEFKHDPDKFHHVELFDAYNHEFIKLRKYVSSNDAYYCEVYTLDYDSGEYCFSYFALLTDLYLSSCIIKGEYDD